MNKNQSMEEVSVTEIINKYNLIVPEIQREYVWGKNDFQILDGFFEDIKEGYKKQIDSSDNNNKVLINLKSIVESGNSDYHYDIGKFIEQLKTKKSQINIGFIYSYLPDYYVFNDRYEDVYLIDGQQRFTTLFLALFYFSIVENRKDEFMELFRFDKETGHIAFDYRVRTLTHNFIIDLIDKVKTIDDIKNINTKTWFLSDYKNDITIQSIANNKAINGYETGTFPLLLKHFSEKSIGYYDYIKTYIKFWHFKTEETSQGEELYITMNSRGQQLADNETIRAKLFETEEAKTNQIKWSTKWEEWQDFFWKKRNQDDLNPTADKGFNEFLRWIQIIEMTKADNEFLDDENEEISNKNETVRIVKWDDIKKLNIKYLKFDTISCYFDALKYLFKDLDLRLIKPDYFGYNNFELIDEKLIGPKDNTIGQIDCFKLLPVLCYCKEFTDKNEIIDTKSVFRLIRFFYNLGRDPNVNKSPAVSCINALKLVNELKNNDDIIRFLSIEKISKTLLNEEESNKLNIYKVNPNQREKIETIFWKAEDLEINNGKISHLLKITKNNCNETNDIFCLDDFSNIFNSYKELTDEELEIWGDLLPLNVYQEIESRVIWLKKDWHISEDFLNLTVDWCKSKCTLNEFLISRRKKFIKEYKSIDELKNESSYKKQLYIYFILHSNILKNWKWNWNDGRNFGIIEQSNDTKSLFENKKIYQIYNKQWRYSSGYDPNYGIRIQNEKPNSNIFEDLIKWANK